MKEITHFELLETIGKVKKGIKFESIGHGIVLPDHNNNDIILHFTDTKMFKPIYEDDVQ